MRFLSFAKVSAALAVVAVVLAACTVVVDEGPGPGPRPPRPDGPGFCTREYAPVCGERGRERQTFPNACVARAEGYRVAHPGECRLGGGGGGGGGDRPGFCTREYAPVCARRGRDVRTFPNACEARAADYRILGPGAC